MNQINFMGRLVADPEIKYTSGENATCIASFRIAVDKRFKRRDNTDAPTADFFKITAFSKLGEFCEKYLKQGTKIVMTGRIENNNFTDVNGNKVYRDQIIAESIEFAESKKAAESNGTTAPAPQADNFININQGLDDSLPWK